jgi:membrane-associated phospholipid phosphatase
LACDLPCVSETASSSDEIPAVERADLNGAELVRAPGPRARRWWRALGLRVAPVVAYLTLAGIVFEKQGVPIGEDRLLAWVLGGLVCLSLTNVSRLVRGVFLEWLPLAAALTLYDVSRGVGGGRVPIHSLMQIWIDKWVLGFGHVPTVWLQQHLWDPLDLRWYDYAIWATYMSYFLVTPLVLGLLWFRNGRRFRRYALLLTILSFSALAFFIVSPTTPPWLASEHGQIGPVARVAWLTGNHVPVIDDTSLYERGMSIENDLAAFPSLHEGMTILLALFFWPTARRMRPLLAAYPVVMGFTLVAAGEHYVTDLVGGALLAALVFVGVRRIEQRLERLRLERAPMSAPLRALAVVLAHW